MEHLTLEQLDTEDGRKLFKYLRGEILRLEQRIAFQNKVAAKAFLKPHEHAVFEELINT